MAKKEKLSKQQRQQSLPQEQGPVHRHMLVMWLAPLIVLFILLAGWFWWRPISDWLDGFRPASAQQNAEKTTPATVVTTKSGAADGTAGQQPQVTVNTSGGSGGASGSGGSGGDSGLGGRGSNTTDLAQLYREVESGDTYSQVKSLVGNPDDCIQTLLGALGLQKVCTWYDGSSSMVVTFIDDNVVSKTDIGL